MRLHLRGTVQGVGFRPFVYRLAHQCGLTGWVLNGRDGVHIAVEGASPHLADFRERVVAEAPAIARVTSLDCRSTAVEGYADFDIVHSAEDGPPDLHILPDLDLCPGCRAELWDAANRRHRYAFTTCTDCGPRYSIMTALPYDRPRTAMDPFPMCPECRREYDTPGERRFYSQTNSCPACGIRMALRDGSGTVRGSDDAAVALVLEALEAGSIVAVKGLGGYLLMADAADEGAVARLRERKHRPAKPFALMYPDLERVRRDAHVSDREAHLLLSRQKPIVLLRRRESLRDIAPTVAPGLDSLGVMLPYTPLHDLLLHDFGAPLVATSGNRSGDPIAATEAEALARLGDIADLFLTHDRAIITRQDDSVLRVAPDSGRTIVLRRSRGFAPSVPPDLLKPARDAAILALGAEQKSAVALAAGGNLHVSQYLGALSSFDTEAHFQATVRHLMDLLDSRPRDIAVDAHPQYAATRFGEALAAERGARLHRVGHHEAHLWALLADRGLLEMDRPLLGVIWDGAGWGDDGTVWGGEMFRWERGGSERIAHLAPFALLAGDKAAREPRLPALALFRGMADERLRPHFTESEWAVYGKRLAARSDFHTSSMGRLFDAVASLLGMSQRTSYEGEAAIYLEQAARRDWEGGGADRMACEGYALGADAPLGAVATGPLCEAIAADLAQGVAVERIALRFHLGLVRWIDAAASAADLADIGFSGGVFQNALLVDLLERFPGERFRLWFHETLSPNDEGIAVGQVAAVVGRERVSA